MDRDRTPVDRPTPGSPEPPASLEAPGSLGDRVLTELLLADAGGRDGAQHGAQFLCGQAAAGPAHAGRETPAAPTQPEPAIEPQPVKEEPPSARAPSASGISAEYLALLARELRNPLAPIGYALEILKRLGGRHPEVEQASLAIERQLKHLSRLTNELVEVSRSSWERVELERSAADLRDVVGDAVDATRSLFEGRGHRLEVRLPAEAFLIEVDRARLAQALVDLLANAAKYTPPGGTIVISVEPQAEDARLSVSDDGMGLPPALLEELNGESEPGGMVRSALPGQGLSRARRIIELHGGRLRASSPGSGRGSELETRLPAPGRPAGSPGRPDGVPKPRRVLVVEDNPDNQRMLCALLELMGHEVFLAASGREAVKMAVKLRPDVGLVDIGLPGIDGYETARRIRLKIEGILLVALSGYGEGEHRERAVEAGFDAHLVKPVEAADLERVIARSRASAAPGSDR